MVFATAIFASGAALNPQRASANEEPSHSQESGDHEYPHSHLALFVGAGVEKHENQHKEDGSALGIEYELQFNAKWGVGLDVERLVGGDTERSWVVAMPVSYHPSEHWRLFAGPGLEPREDRDKKMLRLGVAYEFDLENGWTASPEVLLDFLDGGAKTIVIGIALGHGF